MQTEKEVTVAKPAIGGSVYVGATTATLPTDAKTTLAEAFENLGYIADSGVTNDNSPSVNTIKAWGGDTVNVSQSERPDTWKFKLIQATNPNVLKVIYGDEYVTGELTTGLTVKATANQLEQKAWVFDMILKNNALKRIVIPKGMVSSLSTISYVDSDAVGYEIEITAMSDDSGVTHYEYMIAA